MICRDIVLLITSLFSELGGHVLIDAAVDEYSQNRRTVYKLCAQSSVKKIPIVNDVFGDFPTTFSSS